MSLLTPLSGVYMTTVRTTELPTVRVLSVDGHLCFPHTRGLGRRVCALLRAGERAIVLDLGRVARIDAAGIGELVRAYNMTTAVDGELQIVHATTRVREMLELAGLYAVLSGDTRSDRVRQDA
jgi:anti-anti-sigma factor